MVNRKSPNYVQSSKYLTALLYPHNQLHIESYHRCVKTLNGLTVEEFLEKLSAIFAVEKQEVGAADAAANDCIGMYLSGQWYSLRLLESYRIDPSDPMSHIDAQVSKFCLPLFCLFLMCVPVDSDGSSV